MTHSPCVTWLYGSNFLRLRRAYKLTITTEGQTGVSAGKWLKNTGGLAMTGHGRPGGPPSTPVGTVTPQEAS